MLTCMTAPIIESDAESVVDEAPSTTADKPNDAEDEKMKDDIVEADEEDDEEDEETYVGTTLTNIQVAHF